ncbi:unnamed protein product [Sphenostylis stenocarpa]|uniref:CRC domain-containing protein n=1 Tax=Sphenostylis stenocarpa TaxID=92480 RepID=A0AA86TGX5_9FABA|nr:unnamed protein product [Sphenostylis stenocarpa]
MKLKKAVQKITLVQNPPPTPRFVRIKEEEKAKTLHELLDHLQFFGNATRNRESFRVTLLPTAPLLGEIGFWSLITKDGTERNDFGFRSADIGKAIGFHCRLWRSAAPETAASVITAAFASAACVAIAVKFAATGATAVVIFRAAGATAGSSNSAARAETSGEGVASAGIYCDGCNCVNCHNNVDNEAARQEAVGITLERNPNAFRPKIASSPQEPRNSKETEIQVIGKHNKGCHCKKSGCLKKYCECFQANILCSENCKCMDCKNFEESTERRAIFQRDYNLDHIKQPTNAAITEVVGSSGYRTRITPRKRKIQEMFPRKSAADQIVNVTAQYLQEIDRMASSPPSLSESFVSEHANARISGSSRSTYRSVLADVLQPQNVTNLCSLFVILSRVALNTNAETRGNTKTGNLKASAASSAKSLRETKDVRQPVCDDHVNKAEADAVDIADYNRPMSPETLALMCDEQDNMLFGNRSANEAAYQNTIQKSFNFDARSTVVYGEQERIIMTNFLDVLRELVTFGSIKG